MRAVLYCAISALTSGSSWIICSASAWRRVALGGVARAGVSAAAPASISSRTGAPSGSASAACSCSRSAGVRSVLALDAQPPERSPAAVDDARRTRACIASSRTIAVMAAGCDQALHQLDPAVGRGAHRAATGVAGGRRSSAPAATAPAPPAAIGDRRRRRRRRCVARRPDSPPSRDAAAGAAARARRLGAAPAPARGARRRRAPSAGANASMRSSTITRPLYSSGASAQLGAAVQDDAVEQLRLVGRQQRRPGGARPRLSGSSSSSAPGTACSDRHLLQQRRHLLERAGGREAELAQAVDGGDQRARRRAPPAPRRSATAWPRSTAPSIWRTPLPRSRPPP